MKTVRTCAEDHVLTLPLADQQNPHTELLIYNAFIAGYECKLGIIDFSEVSTKAISNLVCHYYSIPEIAIRKKGRIEKYTEPRLIIMHFAQKYTREKQREIAGYFNRPHTIVVYAKKTVAALYETDCHYRMVVDSIELLLKKAIDKIYSIS